MGWIGVDLDGTLAAHGDNFDPSVVGPPIPQMVERVRGWLDEGKDIRIFTARVSSDGTDAGRQAIELSRAAIEAWCDKHLGKVLPITNMKDYEMEEFYDDRAVQVGRNTGEIIGYSTRGNHV